MPNSSSPLPLLALEPELELPAPEAPPAIAMAAELGSSWHRPLRFLFPQIKPPAAFLASPRASQGRPPLLIAAGELPPRHPMAAVALLPWSSPVRPSYTTTEPPDRFNSPPGSSPTPPPPPQATGTPPPLHRPAAAHCFTPASPVRPSPRAPRPPTGTIDEPREGCDVGVEPEDGEWWTHPEDGRMDPDVHDRKKMFAEQLFFN
ncbi:vegetative cell wall protein gp1-like [Panicum virgatum]|uniref:vegetative cell wall protein gp1-like n=1 Tax=Panicum virgatum TaxID=38727 RepID=UPI0019D59514|nr:vegetative cell wall protein gp1-like [Panicum virgatum]